MLISACFIDYSLVMGCVNNHNKTFSQLVSYPLNTRYPQAFPQPVDNFAKTSCGRMWITFFACITGA